MIKKISYTAISLASLLFPSVVFAQGASSNPGTNVGVSGDIVPTDMLKDYSVIQILQAVIRFILVVAFVAAFIMLLIGGIRWILAGGDEKAVSSARSTITAALIGLVIVLLAFAIIKLVEAFFGVNVISGGVCIPSIGGGCGTPTNP